MLRHSSSRHGSGLKILSIIVMFSWNPKGAFSPTTINKSNLLKYFKQVWSTKFLYRTNETNPNCQDKLILQLSDIISHELIRWYTERSDAILDRHRSSQPMKVRGNNEVRQTRQIILHFLVQPPSWYIHHLFGITCKMDWHWRHPIERPPLSHMGQHRPHPFERAIM